VVPDQARATRWRSRLSAGHLSAATGLELLADYGVAVVRTLTADSVDGAVAAASAIGYPVVLKTDEPSVAHKSDQGGVVLGLTDAAQVRVAYEDVAGRLGPQVSVSATAPAGVEVALGLVHDEQLGPLLLVAAGGVLVELMHDRALAVPPVDRDRALALLGRLRMRPLLDGVRGAPPADVGALVDAVLALSTMAVELGDVLAAVDVNPLLCGPHGAVAVDALVLPQ
jgi:succinyl-CoA synthetase beta subunit